MKTKKQKREKLLAKFQEELEVLESERKKQQELISNRYYIRPNSRQYYVESQIDALKRNLGILPIQLARKQNEN